MADMNMTSNATTRREADTQMRFNSKSALGVDTKKIASNSTFSQAMGGLQQDSSQRI